MTDRNLGNSQPNFNKNQNKFIESKSAIAIIKGTNKKDLIETIIKAAIIPNTKDFFNGPLTLTEIRIKNYRNGLIKIQDIRNVIWWCTKAVYSEPILGHRLPQASRQSLQKDGLSMQNCTIKLRRNDLIR